MQRKIEPKNLKIYSKTELKERCAVNIQYYLTLIPPEGPFYRRPLPGTPPRYSLQENIDEQLIMKQTGHRSQDAVR